MGTQACVYLPSLKKFSFLWVGGLGRGGAGVLDCMSSPRRVRAERRQGVLKRKCHRQRVSTYPSIHPFILSDYHVTGSEATKVNITRAGSWEILSKYLLNEWFWVCALALLWLSFPTRGHFVLSTWQIISCIVHPTDNRGIAHSLHKKNIPAYSLPSWS